MAQYCDKLLKIFDNPMNVGSMDENDPDVGVGEVGSPNCLVSGTKVWLSTGLVNIEECKVGDMVVSHDGSCNKILRVHKRQYKGWVHQVRNRMGSITSTPDHMVQSIVIPRGDQFKSKYNSTCHKKLLSKAWVHISELEKKDVIIFPRFFLATDFSSLKIDKIIGPVKKSKWDFTSKDIPNKIPLNDEVLRMFGYYLAEGCSALRSRSGSVCFCLHTKEISIQKEIQSTFKKYFSLQGSVYVRRKQHSMNVVFHNKRVSLLFRTLFGIGAENKSIPAFLMDLPTKKQKHILCGAWRGDGCINQKKYNRAGYSTISYILVNQLARLLVAQGIVPTIGTEKAKKDNKGTKHRQCYRLHIGNNEAIKIMCSILRIKKKYRDQRKEERSSWVDDSFAYALVDKISKKKYSGWVYNLEVEDTHSFISPAFSLHNCGDMFDLYIRVEKDTRKITDAKFKCYGCCAAIASASLMTTMIIGKTIDEALKIKNTEIVEDLSLPIIKIHCSLLVEESILAAVQNWQAKQDKQKVETGDKK